MDCSMPGLPVHHRLPELTQTYVHQVGDAIKPSHPLSSLLLLSFFPSIRTFSNESVLRIRWPKYWNFSISPSSEYLGLISFRIDWFDILAVQGTIKGLLQYNSSKSSILQGSAFFFSNSHFHTWLLGKPELSLEGPLLAKWYLCFFNILSRLVITFLPRSKCLLISWLPSPSVISVQFSCSVMSNSLWPHGL